MKVLTLLLSSLFVPTLVFADSDFRFETSGSENHIVLSNFKKKIESPNLLLGTETTSVIFADLGTIWRWDVSLKSYEESPLDQGWVRHPEDAPTPKEPFKIKKLPNSRKFSGFDSQGYQLSSPGQEDLVLWMSDSPVLKALKPEICEFQSALDKKLASPKTADPDSEVVTLMKFFDAGVANLIRGTGALPTGFPVAMIKASDNAEVLYELKGAMISTSAENAFQVPEGYRKVKSLMEDQINGMKGN